MACPDIYHPAMRLSEGVEWSLHSATVLALLPAGVALPASRLAEFHGVPAAYLAKSLQAMTRAGIVESVPGRRGGYRLGGRADQITVLDIVLAVEGDEMAFRCTEIRRRGPSRVDAACYRPTCGVAATMWRAEQAWRESLASTTVADLAADAAQAIPPEAATKAVAWMQEVLS